MSVSVQAQYSVTNIPEELKENANAVFRVQEGEFNIESIDRATYRERKVITILNEKAKEHGYVFAYYDKLKKLEDFSASVYDKHGAIIKKLKKSDIIDQSAISGASLYEDNRVKYADLTQEDYPYTVEFEFQFGYKYLYTVPNWIVLPDENVSVQKSSYKVTAPTSLKPRYKMFGVKTAPLISEKKGIISYSWTFDSWKAQEYEIFGKGLPSNAGVKLGPTSFKYEGYEGSMNSWDDLAEWQLSLNAGRDDLGSATKSKIQELVAGISDDKEKIRIVYEYMQSRTRYVSIQLGIGGFQPFNTSIVDNEGYGDCKALSFYTQSLLKAAGIKSHYTWVYGGSRPPSVDKEFPDDVFNHIILCVPNKGDTLWLECTSQNVPMGYLGDFTGDRDVLVISEEGGKIVHTPSYEHENNRISSSGLIKIDKLGDADAAVAFEFKGSAVDFRDLRGFYYQTKDKQDKWIKNYVDIPNYDLNEFQIKETKGMIPEIDLTLDLGIRGLASTTGKRLFLKPNMFSESRFVPPSMDRKTPIYFRQSRLVQDSLVFEIPAGAFIEKLPEPVSIESDFGTYNVTYDMVDNRLVYKRTYKTNKGKYDKEKYQQLIDFFKSIRRNDRKKILISLET